METFVQNDGIENAVAYTQSMTLNPLSANDENASSVEPVTVESITTKDTNKPKKQVASLRSPSLFKTAHDIITRKLNPDNFLLEYLIPSDNITVLAGSSDAGKSLFARSLAIAAVTGEPTFAGLKLSAKNKKVVYVSTEDSESDWQRILLKMSLTQQEKDSLIRLNVEIGYDPSLLSKLAELLKMEKIDLLVIDVIADAIPGDSNNSTAVREFYKPYKGLANKHGFAVLFIHHLRKSADKTDTSKADLVGSQSFEAASRSALILRQDSKDPSVRIINIVKGNSLSHKDKQKDYRFILDGNLRYSSGGIVSSSVGRNSASTSPEIVNRVIELSIQRNSVRRISEILEKEGISLSKTAVNEILKKHKESDISILEKKLEKHPG